MVFKRRNKLTFLQTLAHAIWPRGGWGRAFHYMRHRVRRLPDTPHKIARGVFAGVFTVFTPFFGLHFLVAALLARTMRGNIVAALLATFVGNPLTYVPIGVISMKIGHLLLGTKFDPNAHHSIAGKFFGAAEDLRANTLALFTDADANWMALGQFWQEVFKPYMVGGIIPGIIAGLVGYYLTLPVIHAYQKRRKGRLKAKLEELRARAAAKKAAKAEAHEAAPLASELAKEQPSDTVDPTHDDQAA
ncbi:MAG: hypothetical protein ACJA06_000828 [Halocynthiibacter sp.]|jgi:uncharacterized protein (DUF2062 family)